MLHCNRPVLGDRPSSVLPGDGQPTRRRCDRARAWDHDVGEYGCRVRGWRRGNCTSSSTKKASVCRYAGASEPLSRSRPGHDCRTGAEHHETPSRLRSGRSGWRRASGDQQRENTDDRLDNVTIIFIFACFASASLSSRNRHGESQIAPATLDIAIDRLIHQTLL